MELKGHLHVQIKENHFMFMNGLIDETIMIMSGTP